MEKKNLNIAVQSTENVVNKKAELTNASLLKVLKEQGIYITGKQNEGHLIHEILEVAVNNHISKKYLEKFEWRSQSDLEVLGKLKTIERQIPTQTWRGEEQIKLQQFSTPPSVAYLLARILNPSHNELVLEPSAGTGSLAMWLRIAGCKIHVNELSATRRMLLELQGYEPTAYDAEFLDEFLPPEIIPDGVIMNPPFSSSGGRTKTNDASYGFRHVRSALSRLKAGGRLIALLGTESATKTEKSRKFWDEVAAEHDLRAIIHLPKNAFYKYGTSVGTSIFCIGKNEPRAEGGIAKQTRKTVLEIGCETLEECLKYTDVFN